MADPQAQRGAAPIVLAHPRLLGLGLVGANLFGLLGLGVLLSGAFAAPQDTVPPAEAFPVGAPPAFATSDSNRTMIAVTGVDVTGASVLYLVDTEHKQLAVYQATGGAKSTQGLKLVGARRIDLDLQLVGFHDDSEYSYQDLEKQFADIPVANGANKPGK
ncbi:MAG: hypothetical protein R3F34_07330 [Planctomycetota bacterium]